MAKSGKITGAKGRLEEAAGALRNNKQQRSKGRADQSFRKLKQTRAKLNDAGNNLKDAFKK